jgi:hypothetical protein
MWWIALWSLVTAAGAAGVVAATNSVRFHGLVTREVRQAWSARPPQGEIDASGIANLPQPVRRYLGKALGQRRRTVSTVTLYHTGTFRPSLTGGWLPIAGRQYFTSAPPGFIWWGRVRVVPGIWIDARDRSVNGVGNMLVRAESTITLADAKGPELDQGAMLRLLGEMPWMPTAFLDERYVQWSPIDDRSAQATLTISGHQVSGTFRFGNDDLPAEFLADRFRDVGGGKTRLTPFIGKSSNYREVDGILVPHRVVGSWFVDGKIVEYARFDVQRIEFDLTAGV